MNLHRRRFIAAGALGVAALGFAGWWAFLRGKSAGTAADAERAAILRAIVPAMLAGALPDAPGERQTAIGETVAGVDRIVVRLPPHAQREIGQLFALLAAAPARRALAGVVSAWEDAGAAEVDAFLVRWRDSGWELKRAAYDALHQLVYGAWYANPRSWPAIGYGGPPQLARPGAPKANG